MDRLVRDDRKTTVTRYNQDLQNTISEHTTHRTLKMDSSSRRPHRVPLRSDKNSTRRIQFTQDHQNMTIEDCKNGAWSDECRFLLRHADSRVRIWRKEHESLDPTWQWVHFTQMSSTVTRSQSNRAPLGCGGTRDSHHGCADDKSAATVWCGHVKMDLFTSLTLPQRLVKNLLKIY